MTTGLQTSKAVRVRKNHMDNALAVEEGHSSRQVHGNPLASASSSGSMISEAWCDDAHLDTPDNSPAFSVSLAARLMEQIR